MNRKGTFSSFRRGWALAHAPLSPGLQPFAPKLSQGRRCVSSDICNFARREPHLAQTAPNRLAKQLRK